MGTFFLGITLIIVGSLGNNLGNNLVSLGHKNDKEKKEYEKKYKKGRNSKVHPNPTDPSLTQEKLKILNEDEVVTDIQQNEKSPKKSRNWRVIGQVIFVLGNLFTFASFGFGAQSLIASLESVQFVSNVFFVHFVHKEPVTSRMIMATCSIIVGNILVVLFSKEESVLYTSHKLMHLYATNTVYHVYLAGACILFCITLFTWKKYYNSRIKARVLLWNHTFVEPFCFAVSSAIVGTQAVLNSKCMSMMLQVTQPARIYLSIIYLNHH